MATTVYKVKTAITKSGTAPIPVGTFINVKKVDVFGTETYQTTYNGQEYTVPLSSIIVLTDDDTLALSMGSMKISTGGRRRSRHRRSKRRGTKRTRRHK